MELSIVSNCSSSRRRRRKRRRSSSSRHSRRSSSCNISIASSDPSRYPVCNVNAPKASLHFPTGSPGAQPVACLCFDSLIESVFLFSCTGVPESISNCGLWRASSWRPTRRLPRRHRVALGRCVFIYLFIYVFIYLFIYIYI